MIILNTFGKINFSIIILYVRFYNCFIYIYFVLILILIYLFIYVAEKRDLITGIVSILSSSTLVIGLVSYISTENDKIIQETKSNQKNYIDFISGSFDKIDNYYI